MREGTGPEPRELGRGTAGLTAPSTVQGPESDQREATGKQAASLLGSRPWHTAGLPSPRIYGLKAADNDNHSGITHMV